MKINKVFERVKKLEKFLQIHLSLYITSNKSMLHGIRRFNIYYNCNFNSSGNIESVYVVTAGYCSIDNSILHLHVLKGT